MREPIWVTADLAVALNLQLVSQTGEPHGVRDIGLLESACAAPINRFYYEEEADVVRLAVSLIIAIARNHPFQQGNKRVAFTAGALFLELNGYDFELADTTAAADLLVAILEGAAQAEELEQIITPSVSPFGRDD